MKGGKTRYALLGWLSVKPMSGYDVKRLTEENLGFFWNGSFGQIYPILHELEREGLVTVHEEKVGPYPARKVYTLTDSGREELRAWLRDAECEVSFRSELLLKLTFSAEVEPAYALEKVNRQLNESELLLRNYKEFSKQFATKEGPGHVYNRLIIEMGIRVEQAVLEWSQYAQKILEELKDA